MAGVARFVACVAITYGALVSTVPRAPLAALYRAVGNVLFGTFGADRIAQFDPLQDPQGLHDTRIQIGTARDGRQLFRRSMPVNSFHEAFALLAMALALSLWTPVSLRDRFWTGALVVGGSLVFVGLRAGVTLAAGFSIVGSESQHLLEVPHVLRWMLRRGSQVLGSAIELDLMVPTAIWALVVLRRWDVEKLFSVGAAHRGGAGSKPATQRLARDSGRSSPSADPSS